jgi:hypothetical protein
MTSSAQSSKGLKVRSLRLPLFLCALLAVGGGVFLFSTYGASQKVLIEDANGTRTTLDLAALRAQPLLNLKTNNNERLAYDSARTLLVLMTAGDCSNCLNERAYWEQLAHTYQPAQFRVVCILVNTSASEARTLLRAYNPTFDFYLDANNQIKQGTPLPARMPFKVLVDQKGKVLLAAGPDPDAAGQKAFNDSVSAQLQAALPAR